MLSWFTNKDYKTLSQLQGGGYAKYSLKPQKDKRAAISIGVIDDEQFYPQNNLENAGYKITILGNPNNIDVTAPHQIILCDLKGVGFGSSSGTQGALLIKEVKRQYPEKYVMAYSGEIASSPLVRQAKSESDGFIKKDADLEAWIQALDPIIDKSLDPLSVWQRVRLSMVQRGIDTLSILKSEDAYVRSFLSSNSGSQSIFESYVSSGKIGEDVRDVLRSLVTSGLVRVLLGS